MNIRYKPNRNQLAPSHAEKAKAPLMYNYMIVLKAQKKILKTTAIRFGLNKIETHYDNAVESFLLITTKNIKMTIKKDLHTNSRFCFTNMDRDIIAIIKTL